MKWQSTPVLLPGKSHGQRSLVGYSLWGRKEPDMTEQLHFHLEQSNCGNKNCLQKQKTFSEITLILESGIQGDIV